jgi:hypothetical protein
MNERDFLSELKKRATEQERVMANMPFPHMFTNVAIWLGDHPWRILIPFAIFLSIFFHFVLGHSYDSLILKIFGGFGIL